MGLAIDVQEFRAILLRTSRGNHGMTMETAILRPSLMFAPAFAPARSGLVSPASSRSQASEQACDLHVLGVCASARVFPRNFELSFPQVRAL